MKATLCCLVVVSANLMSLSVTDSQASHSNRHSSPTDPVGIQRSEMAAGRPGFPGRKDREHRLSARIYVDYLRRGRLGQSLEVEQQRHHLGADF
ncbi:MAG: hypothetical protein ACYS0H_23510 [Planctomycetota bacterium]